MTAPSERQVPPPRDAAGRVRALLGEEGERLGARLDEAVDAVLSGAEPQAVEVFRRRVVAGESAEAIVRSGAARGSGEVEQVVRDLVRQIRAEALRPSGPRRPPASPATPLEPLPTVSTRASLPAGPAVGRDPSRPPHRDGPSLSTVEVVRNVRGPRRAWPWVLAAAVAAVLVALRLLWWGPAHDGERLARIGVDLSAGALTASQIAPFRHPAFPDRAPRGDLRGALEALKRAVDQDPKNASAHLALAWLYLAHRQDADARFQILEAETYGADPASVQLGRALIAFRTSLSARTPGDRDDSLAQADEHLSRVGPSDEGYREAVFDRVLVARARGHDDHARELATSYARLVPDDPLNADLEALLRGPVPGG
ncbi:tetratricopeptide repeat protein [Myxococcota bacterium]|nr:tetratricopeptide repeat protein [Myxococcota bacterium]